MKRLLFTITIFLCSLNVLFASQLVAANLSTGSTIFVPAHRGFYQFHGSTRDSYPLTSTVHLYNIDPKQTIELISIDFFDPSGNLLKNLILGPLLIKPLNSTEITLEPRMKPEDCGGHIIVRWKSDKPANTPVVEVLMVGHVFNRVVSFLTRGC